MSYAVLVTLLLPNERGSAFGNYIVSLKLPSNNRTKIVASGSVCNNCKESQEYFNCKESQYSFPCPCFQDLCKLVNASGLDCLCSCL